MGGGGKKGGATQKLPYYYMTMDYGACYGPIDSVNQIFVKEKPIWCGYQTEPGAVYVNQPEIFGGEEKEGGVRGVIECYFGTADQKMSGVFANKLGLTSDTAPGYRDIAHFVFRAPEEGEDAPDDASQTDNKITRYNSGKLTDAIPPNPTKRGFWWVTNNPYLPSTWINLTRLPKSLSAQYSMILADPNADYSLGDPYSATFVIDSTEAADTFLLDGWNTYAEPFYNVTDWENGKPPTVLSLVDGLGIPAEVIDNGGCTISLYWAAATVGSLDGGAVCTMYLNSWDGNAASWSGDPASKLTYLGAKISDAAANPQVQFHTVEDGGPGYGSINLTLYPGTRHLTFDGGYAVYYLVLDVLSPNDRRGSLSAAKLMPKHCAIDGRLYWLPDANPAHMIYECLTNTDWGMGAPASSIDTVSFMASAETLFNERFGLSMAWIEQSEIEKMVSEIIDHIQAVLYLDPQDGLWHLDLIRADYDPATLLVIDDSNSTSINRQRKALGETINEIVISYKDAQTENDKTVTFHDLGNIAAQGQIVSSTRNYYGIRNDVLANKVGARDIRSASYPLFTADITVNRTIGSKLRPGSVVKFSCAEDGIVDMIFRVMKVDYGSPSDRGVKISGTEDVFGLDSTEYTSLQDTVWTDPSSPPAPMTIFQFDTPPLPLVLRSGVSINDVTDDQYPATFSAAYGYQTGANGIDLVTNTTEPNGDISLNVVSTFRITPSGTLSTDLAADLSSTISGTEISAITRRDSPNPGEFIQLGTSGTNSEVLMLDSVVNVPLATPVPDTPVWTKVDTGTPDVHDQSSGSITIEHTGDQDKSDSYFTAADPNADFDYYFALEVTMANDSAVTAGIFVGDDSANRNQICGMLFYNGSIYQQIWHGTTFISEGKRIDGVYQMPVSNEPLNFRVTRTGNELRFFFSKDGTVWTQIEYLADLNVYLQNTAQIGVYLNSNGVTAGVQSKLVLKGIDTAEWGVEARWTVARGMFDTVPQAWPSGTRGWFLGNRLDQLDPTESAAGAEKTYKLLTRSTGGVLPMDSADPVTFTPTDRPYLPFRPANTKLDGSGFGDPDLHYRSDTGIPATITASWAVRNRLTEDTVAVRWTDASETPETSQTTTLRVFENSTGAMVHEYAGLTGTSYAIDVSTLFDYRFYTVKFFSERPGYESLSAAELGLDLERVGYGNNYGYDYGGPI